MCRFMLIWKYCNNSRDTVLRPKMRDTHPVMELHFISILSFHSAACSYLIFSFVFYSFITCRAQPFGQFGQARVCKNKQEIYWQRQVRFSRTSYSLFFLTFLSLHTSFFFHFHRLGAWRYNVMTKSQNGCTANVDSFLKHNHGK